MPEPDKILVPLVVDVTTVYDDACVKIRAINTDNNVVTKVNVLHEPGLSVYKPGATPVATVYVGTDDFARIKGLAHGDSIPLWYYDQLTPDGYLLASFTYVTGGKSYTITYAWRERSNADQLALLCAQMTAMQITLAELQAGQEEATHSLVLRIVEELTRLPHAVKELLLHHWGRDSDGPVSRDVATK